MMTRVLMAAVLVVAVTAAAPAAQAVPWYIPMSDQIAGGFNHIQSLMVLPQVFDATAYSNFFAVGAPPSVDALGHQWQQACTHTDHSVFFAANGPSIGDYMLAWDMWTPGPNAPPVGTVFHYQAYLDNTLKDNADLTFLGGPSHDNWAVTDGTWLMNKPLNEPQWIIGDADLDGDVDFRDYQLLEAGFGTGTTWFQGNFDGDNDVDFRDYQLLEANFGYSSLNLPTIVPQEQFYSVPEPATLTLLVIGAGATFLARRKK